MNMIDLLNPVLREVWSLQDNSMPASFFYDPQAAACLAQGLLQETSGRSVLVVFDSRGRLIAGQRCLKALGSAGWKPISYLVPDTANGSSPVCDDHTYATLKREAPPTDALVAVGSGVISNLTKWLAAEMDKPYATFATVASMNGYTAANVAPAIIMVLRVCLGPELPGFWLPTRRLSQQLRPT